MSDTVNEQAPRSTTPVRTSSGSGSPSSPGARSALRVQLKGQDYDSGAALLAPVAGDSARTDIHSVAQRGISGGGGAMPFGQEIQKSFGRHDISHVQAHTGSAAQSASEAMGAQAYASGDHIAFGTSSPSLHTAAHEAAHVVQQQRGVQLAGGVGREGDVYERHADAVADAVVQGKSAEPILDTMAPAASSTTARPKATQRRAIHRYASASSPVVQREASPGDDGGAGSWAAPDASTPAPVSDEATPAPAGDPGVTDETAASPAGGLAAREGSGAEPAAASDGDRQGSGAEPAAASDEDPALVVRRLRKKSAVERLTLADLLALEAAAVARPELEEAVVGAIDKGFAAHFELEARWVNLDATQYAEIERARQALTKVRRSPLERLVTTYLDTARAFAAKGELSDDQVDSLAAIQRSDPNIAKEISQILTEQVVNEAKADESAPDTSATSSDTTDASATSEPGDESAGSSDTSVDASQVKAEPVPVPADETTPAPADAPPQPEVNRIPGMSELESAVQCARNALVSANVALSKLANLKQQILAKANAKAVAATTLDGVDKAIDERERSKWEKNGWIENAREIASMACDVVVAGAAIAAAMAATGGTAAVIAAGAAAASGTVGGTLTVYSKKDGLFDATDVSYERAQQRFNRAIAEAASALADEDSKLWLGQVQTDVVACEGQVGSQVGGLRSAAAEHDAFAEKGGRATQGAIDAFAGAARRNEVELSKVKPPLSRLQGELEVFEVGGEKALVPGSAADKKLAPLRARPEILPQLELVLNAARSRMSVGGGFHDGMRSDRVQTPAGPMRAERDFVPIVDHQYRVGMFSYVVARTEPAKAALREIGLETLPFPLEGTHFMVDEETALLLQTLSHEGLKSNRGDAATRGQIDLTFGGRTVVIFLDGKMASIEALASAPADVREELSRRYLPTRELFDTSSGKRVRNPVARWQDNFVVAGWPPYCQWKFADVWYDLERPNVGDVHVPPGLASFAR